MKTQRGMKRSTYEHISRHIHKLEIDIKNGLIINRDAKSLNTGGYLVVGLARKPVLQHQIFAVARWGEKCIGMTVNHINEIKTDNSWNNLELLSLSDNIKVRSSGHGYPKQPVKATHLDTGEIFFFESQLDASRKLGLRQNGVSDVLRGIQNHTGRYAFERVI